MTLFETLVITYPICGLLAAFIVRLPPIRTQWWRAGLVMLLGWFGLVGAVIGWGVVMSTQPDPHPTKTWED